MIAHRCARGRSLHFTRIIDSPSFSPWAASLGLPRLAAAWPPSGTRQPPSPRRRSPLLAQAEAGRRPVA
jgi:hypothetical protein